MNSAVATTIHLNKEACRSRAHMAMTKDSATTRKMMNDNDIQSISGPKMSSPLLKVRL